MQLGDFEMNSSVANLTSFEMSNIGVQKEDIIFHKLTNTWY